MEAIYPDSWFTSIYTKPQGQQLAITQNLRGKKVKTNKITL